MDPAVEFVPCPHCAGLVHPVAGRCKHCKGDTRRPPPRPVAAAAPPVLPPAIARPDAPARRRGRIRTFAIAAAVLGALGVAVVAWRLSAASPAAAGVAPDQPLPESVKQPRAGVYARVAGEWQGTGYQYDIDTRWPLVMTIRNEDVPVGDRVGTIDYPSLNCSGELTRDGEDGDTFVVTERITRDPDRRCVATGTIRFQKHGDDIQWKWYFPDGKEGAEARLRAR